MTTSKDQLSSWTHPAEWEEQASIWLAWPHNRDNWQDQLHQIRLFYAALIPVVLLYQRCDLLVHPTCKDDPLLKQLETEAASAHYSLVFHICPTNTIWMRDYGPWFIKDAAGRSFVLNSQFNSWGQKFPPWDADNAVPQYVADALGLSMVHIDLVLEGGSLDFNNDGCALTTLECLNESRRNPGVAHQEILRRVGQHFGLHRIIALPMGLEGDHTDGHIDNVARFIAPEHVVLVDPADCPANSPNRARMQENDDLIPFAKTYLPLPPQHDEHGDIHPASYVNFIFLNAAVVVPQFNCPQDKEALSIFQQLLPERHIIGIDCALLIQEGGGLHCMSKQQPR